MRPTQSNSIRGFTLAELLISMALGAIVLGAAVQMYSKAVDSTFTVTQRAEMQQDVRSVQNIIEKDISLAGSGLPSGGVGLVAGTGTNPKYGCDQAACYINLGNGQVFPANQLYPIIPGRQLGPTVVAARGATDVITVAYSDNTFLLNDYTVTVNGPNGATVMFTAPAVAPVPPPQAVNSVSVGLQVGDLVLFGAGNAIAEVTAAVPAGGGPYTVTFANPDALRINQSVAASGNLKTQVGVAGLVATRIWVITYYIDNTGATPRLMRQVNGTTPVAVADNVNDMRFTYDTYDANGVLLVAQDASAAQPVLPNNIRKVNLSLSFHSPLQGNKGYQGFNIQTSISARNLSFKDRYN